MVINYTAHPTAFIKFTWFSCQLLYPEHNTNILPDTVEAYESGELAKLLGITTSQRDDL